MSDGLLAEMPAQRRDPEETRRRILEAATAEFAQRGLSGARVDEIAARTKTTKRMIYYYFESKERLYLAVLEKAYRDVRSDEQSIRLDDLAPEEALRALVGFTFDRDNTHPDFIRLVCGENINRGEYIAQLASLQKLNIPILVTLARILERGRAAKLFAADVEAIELHFMISALCFFSVSNRHTFSTIFGYDMTSAQSAARRRRIITDMILSYVKSG